MDHADHLLGAGGRIVAVDRDARALRENERAVRGRFPGVELATITADLTGPLSLSELDGIVAANSLHYVARDEQVAVIRDLAAHLRPDGRFVVVEYDVDRGNPWVPHPFSYRSWERLAEAAGLVGTHRIGHVPSRFLDAIYSAESRRPGVADRRSACDACVPATGYPAVISFLPVGLAVLPGFRHPPGHEGPAR